MRTANRGLLAVVALALCGMTVTACGGGSSSSSSNKLVIGAPLALTGPVAAQAKEMQEGFQLYLKQHDGKLAGIPIDLKIADSAGDPGQAVSKARLLIRNDHVDMMVGGSLAPEALAIAGQTESSKMAYISPVASADDLTQRKSSPLVARTNMTSSQPNMPFGAYAADTLHYKRIAIITQDYAYGWESAAGFQYAFEKSGGTIVKKVFVPLGAPDWAPYVAQLPTDVDAVFSLPVGGGVAPFVRAYHQAGLWGKVPLIGGPDLGDEDAIQAIGSEEIGVVHVHDYNPNNPETQAFAKAFDQAYGLVPSYWGACTYVTMMWIDKVLAYHQKQTGDSAAKTIKWITNQPEDFIATFQKVPLDDAPWGPSTMDKYNNAVLNMYVVKIVERDGKPYRETIDTIPKVSQFWTVSPDEFLKQPVFSRTFPK